MMLKTFTLFLFLVSVKAYANFSGTWVGSATLKTPDGSLILCTDLKMAFTENSESWGLVSGNMKCPPYRVKFKPYLLQIEGDKLVGSGKVFGTIKENLVQIHYVNEKGTRVESQILINGNELFYNEIETSASNELLWSTRASLQLSPDFTPLNCQ
jgi:hypothetical protein